MQTSDGQFLIDKKRYQLNNDNSNHFCFLKIGRTNNKKIINCKILKPSIKSIILSDVKGFINIL